MTDGYPLMGPKVHGYLLSPNVDYYAVLRPSYFFSACNRVPGANILTAGTSENSLTVHHRTIKEKNTIISPTLNLPLNAAPH